MRAEREEEEGVGGWMDGGKEGGVSKGDGREGREGGRWDPPPTRSTGQLRD